MGTRYKRAPAGILNSKLFRYKRKVLWALVANERQPVVLVVRKLLFNKSVDRIYAQLGLQTSASQSKREKGKSEQEKMNKFLSKKDTNIEN